jgi:hypothetical protein
MVDKDSCLLLLMRWGRGEVGLYPVRNRCCSPLGTNHHNAAAEEVVAGGEAETCTLRNDCIVSINSNRYITIITGLYVSNLA